MSWWEGNVAMAPDRQAEEDGAVRRFDLRMQLGRGMRARGASLYAEVFSPEAPVYGPALIAIGLCNRDQKLPASGTFVTGPYRGPASKRPAGVKIASLELAAPEHVPAGQRGRSPGRPAP